MNNIAGSLPLNPNVSPNTQLTEINNNERIPQTELTFEDRAGLQFASERLKNDPDIIKAAILNNGFAKAQPDSLKTLDLSGCALLTEASLEHLKSLTQLKN